MKITIGGLYCLLPAFAGALTVTSNTSVVNQTTCNGKTYTYNGLAGYGFIPTDARDKFGDTIGAIGSAIAIDQKSWVHTGNGTYQGIIWALPDRGWSYGRYRDGNAADSLRNTQGTLNYQNRVHKIAAKLTLQPEATASNPAKPNLQLSYLDTILFTGPDGTPTTGLDADVVGPYLSYRRFPTLPAATYPGNGYGGPGSGGHRITVDSEGLRLGIDASFWVSDEYGPYIYQFSSTGRMLQAIRPPEAYIPRRNGTVSFSADSPPIYNPNETIIPANTESGRNNNQGFEGLTLSNDGKKLFGLMQSALDQEGGPNNPNRKQARSSRAWSSFCPQLMFRKFTEQCVFTVQLSCLYKSRDDEAKEKEKGDIKLVLLEQGTRRQALYSV